MTAAVLETLDRYGVPASFFEVGRHLASLRDGGKALLAAKRARGHIVGNHAFSHRRLTELSRQEIERELAQTDNLLRPFVTLKLVRPPFGADDDRVRDILRDLGYIEVTWHVQAAEYEGWDRDYLAGVPGTTDRFVTYLVEKVKRKNGGILLLHDTSPITVATLSRIIEALSGHGLTFVPLEHFLGDRKDRIRG